MTLECFHLTWRDYATGRRDIASAAARAALGLGPRPCPKCGHKPGMQITRLLKRLTARDLKRWHQLREGRQYKAANRILEEVYNRKTTKERNKEAIKERKTT